MDMIHQSKYLSARLAVRTLPRYLTTYGCSGSICALNLWILDLSPCSACLVMLPHSTLDSGVWISPLPTGYSLVAFTTARYHLQIHPQGHSVPGQAGLPLLRGVVLPVVEQPGDEALQDTKFAAALNHHGICLRIPRITHID